jgi:hypothetical protein
MSGYHEIVYDEGDQYKGEWNADGKVGVACSFVPGGRHANTPAAVLCFGSMDEAWYLLSFFILSSVFCCPRTSLTLLPFTILHCA